MVEAPFVRRAMEEGAQLGKALAHTDLLNNLDVPEILAMIRELADFEKCPERVLATEEQLKKTLEFAPGPSNASPSGGWAKVFLLIVPQDDTYDTHAVGGFALFFNNYSTWLACPGIYLEDLYVRPKYRRRGFATILLKRLAFEARKISDGKGRLEWSCLKWNEGALGFYKSIGASQMSEWVGLRIEGDGLSNLIDMPANVTS